MKDKNWESVLMFSFAIVVIVIFGSIIFIGSGKPELHETANGEVRAGGAITFETQCTAGPIGTTYCAESNVFQTYLDANCVKEERQLKSCSYRCENGACTCRPSEINSFNCLRDDLLQAQVGRDCFTTWKKVATCSFGCSEGACRSPRCVATYLNVYSCFEDQLKRKFQNDDCSIRWDTIVSCPNGCSSGACN